ncbi:MAG: helix-turn-helix domain-containing protein [Acidimicrobiales bacterium]
MNLQQQWGSNLRAARQVQGLSLGKLSRLVDMDASGLSKVERGIHGASDDMRIRLANALGVRVEDIWTYPSEVAS